MINKISIICMLVYLIGCGDGILDNTQNNKIIIIPGTSYNASTILFDTKESMIVNMLINKRTYQVTGTFTSFNFGTYKHKNWVYTRKSDSKHLQLLGNNPSANNIFGWKEVNVNPNTENVWYMIRIGSRWYDWILTNINGLAYRMRGAKSDGTFDFSGRLNLNASYKDGVITFTKK